MQGNDILGLESSFVLFRRGVGGWGSALAETNESLALRAVPRKRKAKLEVSQPPWATLAPLYTIYTAHKIFYSFSLRL